MAAIFYAYMSLKDKFTDRERGATAVEYALIIAVVSIGLIIALSVLNISGIVGKINTYLNSVNVGGTTGP